MSAGSKTETKDREAQATSSTAEKSQPQAEPKFWNEFPLIQELLPLLNPSESLGIVACEDLNSLSFRRADSILESLGWAMEGFHGEDSGVDYLMVRRAVDAAQFHLELGRLAAKKLFRLARRSDLPR